MAPIQFGCLVFDYQAIDVFGPTDLLNSSSKTYMQALSAITPVKEETLARAPDFVFHHIGITLEPAPLVSSAITIVPTTTVDECPELDCLLVGGPDPVGFELHPKHAEFIRRHVAAGKLLFTNCTGAAVVASTGVLDGKNATINNVAYELVKQRYPSVKWTNEKKWVVDGNIWTGGGAVAGMDMFSHWLKENFGLDVLTQGALLLDYEPRDIDGILAVIPKRYDESGKQISTHVF
ncbi:class I glutamine amidotransferase-like protein [Thelonectria olida]|uniref:Class I glutamine amidotransferase-like protein n=1 Tax=Thelonectria olida TaxID=1576542 RepID=A0A9P9AJD6_9HYPO|nr:class I glutamine amidotransferase-like protein [Thelonectria olida]